MAIWQDLVDGHGFAGRYASVKRFVRKLVGSFALEARVVIETAPGEEAQVDYGTGLMDAFKERVECLAGYKIHEQLFGSSFITKATPNGKDGSAGAWL